MASNLTYNTPLLGTTSGYIYSDVTLLDTEYAFRAFSTSFGDGTLLSGQVGKRGATEMEWGVPTVLGVAQGTPIRVWKQTADQVVIMYEDGANSNYITAVAVDVNRPLKTLLWGIPLVIRSSSAAGYFQGCRIDDTHFMTFHDTNAYTNVCSLSGTSITKGGLIQTPIGSVYPAQCFMDGANIVFIGTQLGGSINTAKYVLDLPNLRWTTKLWDRTLSIDAYYGSPPQTVLNADGNYQTFYQEGTTAYLTTLMWNSGATGTAVTVDGVSAMYNSTNSADPAPRMNPQIVDGNRVVTFYYTLGGSATRTAETLWSGLVPTVDDSGSAAFIGYGTDTKITADIWPDDSFLVTYSTGIDVTQSMTGNYVSLLTQDDYITELTITAEYEEVILEADSYETVMTITASFTDSVTVVDTYNADLVITAEYSDAQTIIDSYYSDLIVTAEYNDTANVIDSYYAELIVTAEYNDVVTVVDTYGADLVITAEYSDAFLHIDTYYADLTIRAYYSDNLESWLGKKSIGYSTITVSGLDNSKLNIDDVADSKLNVEVTNISALSLEDVKLSKIHTDTEDVSSIL